jgi:hypothetical protein
LATVIAAPKSCEWELLMKVWIGLKKGDEYVSEWIGEIVDEGEIGAAIGKAITDYCKSTGQVIWGMTIMIDKAQSQQ